ALAGDGLQLFVVVGALRHRLFEDRRVRRDAAPAMVADEVVQTAGRERTREVVVPGALPEIVQSQDGAGHFVVLPQERPSNASACSTACSGVMPSSLITVSPGADAPKRSMPTLAFA